MDAIVTIASFFGLFMWGKWYISIWSNKLSKIRRNTSRWLLQVIPFLCLGVIIYVISFFAASDVRDNPAYWLLYVGLGIFWLWVFTWLFRYLGISAEFDVIERANPAALAAISGAMLGVTFCYCGSNVGEGPGAEVVIFAAGLVTISLFLAWWMLTFVTEVDYAITVGRDLAAGLRLSGFLVAAGLILGRSMVGDWVSIDSTIQALYTFGFPVLILLAVAILVEFLAKPTVERPTSSLVLLGILPFLVYTGSSILYLVLGNFTL